MMLNSIYKEINLQDDDSPPSPFKFTLEQLQLINKQLIMRNDHVK